MKPRLVFTLAASALALCSVLSAGEAPGPVAAALQPFVNDHVLAGAVTLVADRSGVRDLEAVGYRDVASRTLMRTDDLFWIASMSKPVTAAAVMMLVDEGKVKLDDPVEKYLPEFKGQMVLVEKDGAHEVLRRPAHPPTIRNLLSHTSGLAFRSAIEQPTLDLYPLAARVRSYAMMPLRFEPGTSYEYTNAGVNTAGRIVEVVSGMPYEDFLAARLFGPLGMKDTTFRPSAAQLRRLATSYRPTPDKSDLQATPIDMLKYPLDGSDRQAMPAGGLFSTAEDFGRFARMLLNGGVFDGHRLLSESAIAEMTRRQTPPGAKVSYGLGLRTNGHVFGHFGHYGTDFSIDPERGIVTVFMVQNAVWRDAEGGKIHPAFQKAAFASLSSSAVDVVVYGGTSAGVTAAVEAARLGSSVVLIEPGRHLGGLTSGGLGMTDTGNKATISGLAREFYHRVYLHYTDPAHWHQKDRDAYMKKMGAVWTPPGGDETARMQFMFEPHVAEAVFDEMARAAGVRVVYGERLDRSNGVEAKGSRIVRIRMESGRTFAGKEFVDTTYEGDLMAAAAVSYAFGREANRVYGETINGILPSGGLLLAKVDPYVVPGEPASGLLPRIEPRPPGPPGEGDRRMQAYNFRVCLTDIPDNRVPIEQPEGYDPKQYELLARYIATLHNVHPGPSRYGAVGLRGPNQDLGVSFHLMPNRKTDCNTGSEFGSDYIGGSYAWAEAGYAERDRLWREHKTYVEGLLWFLGHDARVPQAVRTEMLRWGLPKDEFTDDAHWPFQLYVREARRMVSDYVMTEHNARGQVIADDSVALASYAMDSHGVSFYLDDQGRLWREKGFFVRSGVFPISYRSIRPKATECSNLLVPVALSASHAAYGPIRMEPVFMMLGDAAGTAAALAATQGVTVQALSYRALRQELLAHGQILDWPSAAKPAPGS